MKKILALIVMVMLFVPLLSGCGTKTKLDPDNPVTLTMWHVYGEQADSPMNRLVEEFNNTVGLEKGIIIDVTTMSNSTEIGQLLSDAQAEKPGAEEMPDLFFCHTNNAGALGVDNLIDWQDLFTEEELDGFVKPFVQEGMIDDNLAVLPVSKSTHVLFINGTEFKRFSDDTGVSYDDLKTWDGFFDVAGKYYEWSDGKPFCALDYLMRCVELNEKTSDRNYLTKDGWYDFDSDVLKDSWMQFAEALAAGHIMISDLYANTQVMTGEVAAGISSSAAILYYNDTVTYEDNTSEPLAVEILPFPQRSSGKALATQAGVGLCAYKTTDEKAEAASVFAHWFTESQRNLDFVAETGYMPVTNKAFDAIDDYEFEQESYQKLYKTLQKTVDEYTMVSETNHPDYYPRVYKLYDGLRQMQLQFASEIDAGESVDLLAEDTWELFRSID